MTGLLLGAAGMVLVPSQAQAQAAAEGVAALRKAGAAAAARGDLQGCVRAYVSAQTALYSAQVAGELGLCEEALGRYARAYDHLVSALEAEPPRRGGAARVGPWRRYGEALDRVRDKVARVIVVVEPDEAEVFVDGQSLGTHVDGRFFAVAPGRHTWTARLDGYREAAYEHVVRAGDLPSAHLRLEPARAAPAALEPSPPATRALEPVRAAAGSTAAMEPPRTTSAEAGRFTMGVSLGGFVAAGLAADIGGGLYGGVELRWFDAGALGLVLAGEVRGMFPAKARTRADGTTGDLSVLELAVVPCVRYRWARGCAVFDGGWIFTSGPLFAGEGQGVLPTMGVGPRLALDVPMGERFGVRAFADLRFSLVPAAAGSGDGVVWREPLVSGLLGLGMSFR